MNPALQRPTSNDSILKGWVKLLATFFYVGYLPIAPGTWATLAGLPIAWFFNENLGWLTVIFSLVGLVICKPAKEVFNAKDPGCFVLDEVAGMMVSVLWLPKNLALYGMAFILFRLLDISKPGLIRKIQNCKASTSIMWDDLLAGAVVNVVLQVFVRLVI